MVGEQHSLGIVELLAGVIVQHLITSDHFERFNISVMYTYHTIGV